jgi:hypothetical protein
MAHPMAGQAKASEKRRLGYLSARPGKAWGSSKMYKKTSYPKKHAGSSTPMTISGGKGKKRPDRMAAGGKVRGKGKPHHTTNIVIAAPGGSGGRGTGGGGGGTRPHPVPVPVPVRPPVAPPMAGGAPPAAPPMGAGLGAPMPPRPPMGPMAGGLPPRPLGAGMPGMKSGGVVKKQAGGGVGNGGGRAYRGFPHSPTTDVEDTVSAHKKGGKVGKIEGKLSGLGTREPYAAGGRVGKRANGGSANKKDNDDDSDADGSAAEEINLGDGGGDGGSAGVGDAAGDAPPAAADVAQQMMPSTQRRGGAVKRRQGGGTLPYGGLVGPRPGIQTPQPAQQGVKTISGRAAIPAQPQMIPAPNTLASQRLRPAPGTTVGFKRGGSAKHDDEAQDKKLIRKMLKQEEKREKA